MKESEIKTTAANSVKDSPFFAKGQSDIMFNKQNNSKPFFNGYGNSIQKKGNDIGTYNPDNSNKNPKKDESNSVKNDKGSSAIKTELGSEIAGDAKGKKIIRIAWTIDDGPFGKNTTLMQGSNNSKTGLGGLVSVTWYIQRNKLNPDEYKKLTEIQKNGGEIAIHSFHSKEDHSTWFPISGENTKTGVKAPSAYHTPYGNSTEIEIMKDLISFKKELNDNGINVKFVRLPGGLFSELAAYTRILIGYSNKDSMDFAGKIIKGESVSDIVEKAAKEEAAKVLAAMIEAAKKEATKKEATKKEAAKKGVDKKETSKKETDKKVVVKLDPSKIEAAKAEAARVEAAKIKDDTVKAYNIQNDFKTLKNTLSSLDLLEWSGTTDPIKLANQSWQAETSGVSSRADNTTTSVSAGRAKNIKEAPKDNPGMFERIIDKMKDGEEKSLVILAHDQTKEDADAVYEDKLQMEKYASTHGTMIEYCTMSTLFNKVTKEDILIYDVKYK